MARRKPNPKKFYTGVAFDPEVITYLDQLSRKIGMTRSLALNFILREHARRHGENASVGALDIAKEAVS
jgi:hypothetical protein